jgi:hypothetical protein
MEILPKRNYRKMLFNKSVIPEGERPDPARS